MATKDLSPAQVDWRDNQPVSHHFDDVYYSTDNGLAESQHVFLAGNDLPERWAQLQPGDRFTIAETGFGTGLNFLASIQLWLSTAPESANLHFISVEKFPLPRAALQRALSNWPTLSALTDQLVKAYPPLIQGHHTSWLFEGRIRLTLVFDDALAGYKSLCSSSHPRFADNHQGLVDAWFLDGFAPSKNPDLWSAPLFNLMAAFSHDKTTLATFTVARMVRDGLNEAGFLLEKRKGFGRKRDMLCGRFLEDTPQANFADWQPPKVLKNSHYETTWHLNLTPPEQRTKAIVIGAGIAGCSTAAALGNRGWHVSLIDRHPMAAGEASGNPQGILYPKLSVEDGNLSWFALHALSYAMGFYQQYWQHHPNGKPSGVLVLPETEKDASHFAAIGRRYQAAPEVARLAEKSEFAQLCGIQLQSNAALWCENLGWVEPAVVCRQLSAGIAYTQAEVSTLVYDPQTKEWQLFDRDGGQIDSAPTVVIATATNSCTFDQTLTLPLRGVRGQITTTPATPTSASLTSVICGAGYIAPANIGWHTLGATYHLDNDNTDVTPEDHQKNLATLAETDSALAQWWQDTNPDELAGRAAIRCTTPDYLPLAGPVPVVDEMVSRFAHYRRNAKADIPLPGAYYPGLWINSGHGSRGLTYAPMASELLANLMTGEIPSLPRQLVMALSPARFIIRDIKRGHTP